MELAVKMVNAYFSHPKNQKRKDKTMKKLYRSNTEKRLCGVCGGIAEYLELDPTIIRLLWVIFLFCGTAGFWAYIIAALIMPKQP
jgi:phage shock protein C